MRPPLAIKLFEILSFLGIGLAIPAYQLLPKVQNLFDYNDVKFVLALVLAIILTLAVSRLGINFIRWLLICAAAVGLVIQGVVVFEGYEHDPLALGFIYSAAFINGASIFLLFSSDADAWCHASVTRNPYA